jgi:hypothetical protein
MGNGVGLAVGKAIIGSAELPSLHLALAPRSLQTATPSVKTEGVAGWDD